MAIIFPSDAIMAGFDQWPSELFLLEFLRNTLDDSFEVYFQSAFLDSRPDIVVVRKNYGVIIIEVKEWSLDSYDINHEGDWIMVSNGAKVKSPIRQVLDYKRGLTDLHIEGLLERKVRDLRFNNVIACLVYFHNATEMDMDRLHSRIEYFHKDDLKYNLDILTEEGLSEAAFNTILRKRYLMSCRISFLFDDALYASFVRYLKPPKHLADNIAPIYLTKQQIATTKSAPNLHQRINGVVGSGKSTILAHRAVNAFNRHGRHVLILCYNITLVNYIKNRLQNVPDPFDWAFIHIYTYHDFINSKMDMYEKKMRIPKSIFHGGSQAVIEYIDQHYYSNGKLFEPQKGLIHRYDTILVDEVQDYHRVWLDIIKNYFLAENGEYILLGDAKQNIYNLPIEGKDLITNVIGRPIMLKKSFRSSLPLQNLTLLYQQFFFKEKYHLDDLNEFIQSEINFDSAGLIEYVYQPERPAGAASDIVRLIREYCVKLGEPPGNITVLGFRMSLLREIEAYYRARTGERITTMFETLELWYINIFYEFRNAIFIQEALDLLGHEMSFGKKLRVLAKVMMLRHIFEITQDADIKYRLQGMIDEFQIHEEWFESWIKDAELKQILNFCHYKSDNQLAAKYLPYSKVLRKIKIIRKYKKYHFRTDKNEMKIATVHSFKGWESNTIILILEEQFGAEYGFGASFFEVLYTAITRAHTNLIVLDYGNSKHSILLNNLFSIKSVH